MTMRAQEWAHDPRFDGISHLNAYSRGRTALGRGLSNFAQTPVDLGDHGHFASLEGYWYWLSVDSHARREDLRKLHGSQAKRLGRDLREEVGERRQPDFEWRFQNAQAAKLLTHPPLAHALAACPLVVVHYYVQGRQVVEPRKCAWVWAFYAALRGQLRARGYGQGDLPPLPSYGLNAPE